MDGRTIAATPEDERLTQDECFHLFGPVVDDIVWMDRNGATLLALRDVPESDEAAWQAAMERGDADTADLEWKLYDHGVTRSDVRAQLEVAARVLDDLGVGVEWEADHLGLMFRFGDRNGSIIDMSLSVRNVGFGPIRLFDNHSGGAFPPEHVRRQAVAYIEGVRFDLVHRIYATVFAAEHRIDIPGAALDGMAAEAREWVAKSVRLGAAGDHIVVFARDGHMGFRCIYEGSDMNEAVRAIQDVVPVMEGQESVNDVAAMAMRGGSDRHGTGGVSA